MNHSLIKLKTRLDYIRFWLSAPSPAKDKKKAMYAIEDIVFDMKIKAELEDLVNRDDGQSSKVEPLSALESYRRHDRS